jgi:hypothetical protein
MTARAIRLLLLTGGAFSLAANWAAPIRADMMGTAFLAALSNAGIPYSQPAATIALGQSVCPLVIEGGSFDSVATRMSEPSGMTHDAAAAFTIVAIATYCPALIAPLLPNRLQA